MRAGEVARSHAQRAHGRTNARVSLGFRYRNARIRFAQLFMINLYVHLLIERTVPLRLAFVDALHPRVIVR